MWLNSVEGLGETTKKETLKTYWYDGDRYDRKQKAVLIRNSQRSLGEEP